MSAVISAPLHMVEAVAALRFPAVSDRRLQVLMDRNNDGALSTEERDELESLAELSETISLVRADALALLDAGPTNQVAPLFNPRKDEWNEHFAWLDYPSMMNRLNFILSCLASMVLTAGCAHRAAIAPRAVTLFPAPGSPLPIAANCVAIADVNGDRHQDLILTVDTHLQTYFGDGTGKFAAAPDRNFDMGERATEMAVADVNGDGRVDVVLADHDRYSVSIYLGDGRGDFAPAPGSPFWPKRGQHPHTHGLLLCDVNNDGKLDLITANNADGDIAVMLGDGRGGFTSAAKSVFPCGPSPYPIAAADVNGDGNLDILVPNSQPGVQTMTVLLGNGKGEFAPAPSSPVKTPGDDVYFVTTGDLIGDGRQYAILSNNHNDHATILVNDGRGNFKPAPNSPLSMGNRGWQMAIVDFDHDGKPDLIAVTETSVRVFFGDGGSGFWPSPLVIPSGKGCWKLALGDLNEDGIADVVTPNVETHDVTILLSHKRSP